MADGYAFEDLTNGRSYIGYPTPANAGETVMIVVQFFGPTKTGPTSQLVFGRRGDRFELKVPGLMEGHRSPKPGGGGSIPSGPADPGDGQTATGKAGSAVVARPPHRLQVSPRGA